jgi:hypothetical protein
VPLEAAGPGEIHLDFGHSDFQLVMVFDELHQDYDEWTVGAILRYDLPAATGDSPEEQAGVRAEVSSTGEWSLAAGEAPPREELLGFNPSETDRLTLEFVGQGERGWLFVNNRFVAELDLSAGPDRGTLWVFVDAPDASAGQVVTLSLTFKS